VAQWSYAHYGIDIVVPVCFKGEMMLARNNMLAILIQVKNDNYFCKKNSRNLFRRMGPFDAGLSDDEDEPLPIIRMVFALSSTTTPGITFPPAQNSPDKRKNPEALSKSGSPSPSLQPPPQLSPRRHKRNALLTIISRLQLQSGQFNAGRTINRSMLN
jgi:hypothetical protein